MIALENRGWISLTLIQLGLVNEVNFQHQIVTMISIESIKARLQKT